LALHLGEAGLIPEGFDTIRFLLTLALSIPDHAAKDKLKSLEKNFKAFGDSIGPRNLAIWGKRKQQ